MAEIVSTDAIHLWLVLMKAHAALRAHAEAHVRSLGLGFSDFAVLEVLLHKGPLPVNTIGELVRLTSGSITTAIDRLVAKGLVSRCVHDIDRRARVVSLTDAGRALIEAAFANHAAAIERAAGGLTAVEREQAAGLLKKLGRYAAAQLAAPSGSSSDAR
jgi:MarR family 2-MHQ and catechol resistance regulon transcriptional repressor